MHAGLKMNDLLGTLIQEQYQLKAYPLRIGLDTTRTNLSDGGGRYTNQMVSYLCTGFPQHDFFAFGPEPRKPHAYPNLTHVPYPEVDGLPARLHYLKNMGGLISQYAIDVFHNLCNFGFYRAPCPVVTTVFDLTTLKFPELRSNKLQGWLYKYFVPTLIQRATSIIAISQSTATDLHKYYGITRNVTVTPLGYDRRVFRTDSRGDREVLKRYNLSPGYLFWAGHIVPKKNVEILLQALALLRRTYGLQPQFVMAGKRDHGAKRVFEMVAALGLADQITETGYVPDNDLAALYRQARVFLFPSFYEGFGLPIVEAMACGTPALASNTSSLPEVIENERYMCSPDAAWQWAEKIYELFTDDTRHTQAREWGLSRAKQFSWEACAAATMKVYESIQVPSRNRGTDRAY